MWWGQNDSGKQHLKGLYEKAAARIKDLLPGAELGKIEDAEATNSLARIPFTAPPKNLNFDMAYIDRELKTHVHPEARFMVIQHPDRVMYYVGFPFFKETVSKKKKMTATGASSDQRPLEQVVKHMAGVVVGGALIWVALAVF